MGLPTTRNTTYLPRSVPRIKALDLNALQDLWVAFTTGSSDLFPGGLTFKNLYIDGTGGNDNDAAPGQVKVVGAADDGVPALLLDDVPTAWKAGPQLRLSSTIYGSLYAGLYNGTTEALALVVNARFDPDAAKWVADDPAKAATRIVLTTDPIVVIEGHAAATDWDEADWFNPASAFSFNPSDGVSVFQGEANLNGDVNVGGALDVVTGDAHIGGDLTLDGDVAGDLNVTGDVNATSGNVKGKRFRSAGTAVDSGDFDISGAWGADRSITGVTGDDVAGTVTVHPQGTGITANPTVKLTFADGSFGTAPTVQVKLQASTSSPLAAAITWVVTATYVQWTYHDTPVDDITFSWVAIGR